MNTIVYDDALFRLEFGNENVENQDKAEDNILQEVKKGHFVRKLAQNNKKTRPYIKQKKQKKTTRKTKRNLSMAQKTL